MDEIQSETNGALDEAPVAATAAPAGPMPKLSFEDLFKACEPRPITVDLPDFGGSVVLRGMTREEQTDMRTRAMVKGQVDDLILEALFLETCMVDPRMTAAQATVMQKKLAGPVGKLLSAIIEESGLSEKARSAVGAAFRPA